MGSTVSTQISVVCCSQVEQPCCQFEEEEPEEPEDLQASPVESFRTLLGT